MKEESKKIFERIKNVTNLKSKKEILEEGGVTNYNSAINIIGRTGFKTDWAFKIGQKYNICPNWIMTGEYRQGKCTEEEFAVDLNKWISKKEKKDRRSRIYIEMKIEEALPEFKEWRGKKQKKSLPMIK